MKKSAWWLMIVAASVFGWQGCDTGGGDPDTNDLDQYFEDHPFVSDPRANPVTRDVSITPGSVQVTNAGQKVLFTVKGGKGPWTWDVAIPSRGTVTATQPTDQGIYHATSVGANSVIAYDKYGHAAIGTITAGGATEASLAASASPSSLASNGGKSVLKATGGSAPYSWSVEDIALGNIDSTSGSQVVYTRYNNGDNSVTCQDSTGAKVKVVIQQP